MFERFLRYGLGFSLTRGYLKSEEHRTLADLAGQVDKELRDFYASLM